MNFKKNWKRFWTLSSAREGFTLVELIVVIAILAILAGVAVPAYSGYVKKANMQADMTLASEVAHALTLYYYAHPGTTGGYVVLNQEGTDSTADAVGAAAMEAVFGAGWEKTAALKYDGWSGGIMDIVSGYTPGELELIANSSYLTTSTPSSLMNAVTGMTGLANTVISDRVGGNLAEARSNLVKLFGEDSDIVENLDKLNMTDEDEFTTVISNMLVNQMSTAVENDANLQGMMNLYAAAYIYGEANDDFSAFEAMTDRLSSDELTMNILLGINDEGEEYAGTGFDFLLGSLDFENEEHLAFMEYLEPSDSEDSVSKFEDDCEALSTMMGAVQHIAGGFTDKESLANADLFTTDDVMAQVNAYYNSVKAMDGLYNSGANLDALLNAPDDAIVVLIAEDGSIAVNPGEAYAVNE